MVDPYLYPDVPVLRNKLEIKTEKTLDLVEAERLLGGRSVWYSNDEDIERDLTAAFQAIHDFDWENSAREEFVEGLTTLFPPVWRVHPFREGNTRTVVMLMTLFVEAHGYFFDKDLLATSAGYVRNSFVMASIDRYAEYEHLKQILIDAVCTEPIVPLEDEYIENEPTSKYRKYQTEPYTPAPHTVLDET